MPLPGKNLVFWPLYWGLPGVSTGFIPTLLPSQDHTFRCASVVSYSTSHNLCGEVPVVKYQYWGLGRVFFPQFYCGCSLKTRPSPSPQDKNQGLRCFHLIFVGVACAVRLQNSVHFLFPIPCCVPLTPKIFSKHSFRDQK